MKTEAQLTKEEELHNKQQDIIDKLRRQWILDKGKLTLESVKHILPTTVASAVYACRYEEADHCGGIQDHILYLFDKDNNWIGENLILSRHGTQPTIDHYDIFPNVYTTYDELKYLELI